jgi:RNA polymerase sigma-70 factor (ECF subfamily)
MEPTKDLMPSSCSTTLPSISVADVNGARLGDARARDRLIRQLIPLVASYLRRFPLSEDDRVDAIQASLVQVWRSLGSYRHEAKFSTWVYRISANEALMIMRKARRQRLKTAEVSLDEVALEEILGEEAPTGEEEWDDARVAAHEKLREAFEALPEHYRAVLLAHYAEEQPLHEIAAGLSTTESTIRSRVHRARLMLRRGMGVAPSLADEPAISRVA